ncbi:Dps family protein [Xanthovirga aplysinae]|uniref:Dps family protein n=1 Tax=Xanthovirga aplysinae TaxID=2529853 RepID=UPI0012BBC9AC|nr:Dps family protein [Xanthovirga aplysinae]MTI32826.1 DNA starvation/stationary phase protection protein [Xanthovirga aplysinae]
MKNLIGIEKASAKQISEKLNELLASYQVFYQNLRGFHWNVTGPNFFELHAKFESMYNEAATAIDEIAERILKLENSPLHNFGDYLKVSKVEGVKNVSKDTATVKHTIENMSQLLKIERKILKLASDANDEGTIVLIDDLISSKEKAVWMFSAFLKKAA